MKRIISYAAAFSVACAPVAFAQPDATTDVDAATTPEQQSPLAPEQAQSATPKPPTLDELISGAAPYEPPAAPESQVSATAAPEPVMVIELPPSQAAPPPYAAPQLPPAYAAPQPPPPPIQPQPRQPVFINERGATPDAPPTSRDTAYEQRVLGVFHAAQGRQGALDGRWRVTANGADVYILQFSDPGAGESRIEGAWRNLRHEGSLGASGFIDQVYREGDEMVVRFTDASRRAAELRLRNAVGGAWTGRVIWPEGGAEVVMTRDVSVEVAAFAVPAYVPPPPPPPPRAKPAPTRSKAKAKKSRPSASRSRGRARR